MYIGPTRIAGGCPGHSKPDDVNKFELAPWSPEEP
jgi:hypothetical protein